MFGEFVQFRDRNELGEIQERSSPEGGRETPQITDCISDNTVPDYSDNEQNNEIIPTQEAILDQSSSKLKKG